jgi:uncharacterized membrane protein YfcA
VTVGLALGLFGFGLLVGGYGSLVGAGGGFLMVPAFLLLFRFPTPLAVGTSLAVVFANAAAGSFFYLRQRRIDIRSGLQFAAATVPGAIGGVYLLRLLSARAFELIFGVLLVGIGSFMALGPRRADESVPLQRVMDAGASPGMAVRELVDRKGSRYSYRFIWWRGIALSLVVGAMSSLLGIGGGPLHVPGMVFLLGFPVHVAIATSHFVLALSSLVGSLLYLFQGHVHLRTALLMGAGAVVGARAGTGLAGRLRGSPILRFLSVALLLIGIRLIMGGR